MVEMIFLFNVDDSDDFPFQLYMIFRFQPLICEGVSIPAWKEDIFVKGESF